MFSKTNLGFVPLCVRKLPQMCVFACSHQIPVSHTACSVGMRLNRVEFVCQPVLQLVSSTDPSCNSDISALLLAGEKGGGVW